MAFHFRVGAQSITRRQRHSAVVIHRNAAVSMSDGARNARIHCVDDLPTTSISPAATDVANDGASADTSHVYLPLTFGVTFSMTK